MILLGSATLVFQNTNASIAIFQATLLLWFFYFLHRYLENHNNKYFLSSIVALSLSFFTRIDSILYLPVYIFLFTQHSLKVVIKNILSGSLIILCWYFVFSIHFGYNFTQYSNHNIIFNQLYSGHDYSTTWLKNWLIRPDTFKILSVTTLPIFLVLCLGYLIGGMQERQTNKKKCNNYLLSLAIIGIAIFAFTASDKK